MVQVGSAFEAATVDATTMHIWRTDGSGAWQKVGNVPAAEASVDSVPDKIDGKLLPGADHAVFILHRPFGVTGSSPTEQVFAHSNNGWGVLQSTDASTENSGKSITVDAGGQGLWNGAEFTTDAIKLGSFHTNASNAEGFVIWRTWKLSGESFTMTGATDPSKNVTYNVTDWGQFTSPTGKNFCDIQKDSVDCHLSPTVSASHGGDTYVVISAKGVATVLADGPVDEDGSGDTWAHDNDAPPPPMKNDTYVLEYGNTIKSGSVSCKSSTNGFSCTNGSASFTVSSENLTMSGTRDTSQKQ